MIRSAFRFCTLGLIAAGLLLTSCKKDEDPADPTVGDCRQGVYDVVKEWYLWNDKLPENFNPADYDSPAAVMEALRYKEDDRWSNVSDLEEFNQFFEEGTFVGIGIGLQTDLEGALWITYVYPDSPADQAGLERGYQITHLGGQALESIDDVDAAFGPSDEGFVLDMQLLDRSGGEVHVSATKATVNIKTVLHRETIQTDGGKVGYLVFKNFIETSRSELDQAFSDFQSEGIDELILDLRYNGGGRVSIARQLAGYLAPVGADNQVLLQYLHNEQKKGEDSRVNIDKLGAFDFSRLIILSTSATASASELLINGLRQYMDVVVIGGATHGKPVGSYGFQCGGEFALSPIAFRIANADGVSDYFDGIPQNFDSSDDLTRNFGDIDERMLADALEYIVTGGVTSPSARNIRSYGIASKESIFRRALPELSSF